MAGQLWVTDSLGGYMYSDNLSEELRFAVQPLTKYRQFCDVQEALGKHKGELYHWNVYNDVAAQGTVLVETTAMPETNFTITQGTLTVTEYGNSVPYTGKLDDLSEHNVKEVIHKVLKHDAKKAFDSAAYDQFNSTLLIAEPVGGTDTAAIVLRTDGTATTTNAVALNNTHIKNIVDTMMLVTRDIGIVRFGISKMATKPVNAYTNKGPVSGHMLYSWRNFWLLYWFLTSGQH